MSRILCFGEILWDCLPHGDFLGGAPFNVAYHLQKLGHEPMVVSAVGRDEWGRQALARIHACRISTGQIAEHSDLPTGTVTVELDQKGNAAYVFADPAAWDRITTANPSIVNGTPADAIVFGTLALRHEFNRRKLADLLAIKGMLHVYDVNLRAPYDDLPRALELLEHADVVKVNEKELSLLSGVESLEYSKQEVIPFLKALERLERRTSAKSICVTRGERGAIWRHNKEFFQSDTPKVTVADTIGAGDAFTATLLSGILNGDAQRDRAELLRRSCVLGAFVASRAGAQPEYDPGKLFTKRN